MGKVRVIEIANFRGIKDLRWLPTDGINCLVGPGDSGKSTIIDAIDLCLGARRSVQFTDADFHALDVEAPIVIALTIGELDDTLKSLDSYGLYVRGFVASSGVVEDEPEEDAETVLTVRLVVAGDLEPSWALYSERASSQDQSRSLNWADRVRLAPTRLGMTGDYHLGWSRGSVLNRVSEERPDVSQALAKAGREARSAFGNDAQDQLAETLGIVAATAAELGIPIGDCARAMLDAHSVSLSGGTITLHDEVGVPLRALGTGSSRLLIAGLQRRAAADSSMILIDELELGLEPHRILRLIASLGAKESQPPLQVFMTTHSAVAVCELAGDQLFVVRRQGQQHQILPVGTSNDVQALSRKFPESLLAHSVLFCEGASEVGLLRGLDRFRASKGEVAMAACGTALVDCHGGGPDDIYKRAEALGSLGYRVAILRDNDQSPTPAIERRFVDSGGRVFTWREGRTVEDELFISLTSNAVCSLIGHARELHGDEQIAAHVVSASNGAFDFGALLAQMSHELPLTTRRLLGKAARFKKSGWFKAVGWMEDVAFDVVAPDLMAADQGFQDTIDSVFKWTTDGSG